MPVVVAHSRIGQVVLGLGSLLQWELKDQGHGGGQGQVTLRTTFKVERENQIDVK